MRKKTQLGSVRSSSVLNLKKQLLDEFWEAELRTHNKEKVGVSQNASKITNSLYFYYFYEVTRRKAPDSGILTV